MKVEVIGRVRQVSQVTDQRSPGDEEIVGLSEQGELLVANSIAPYEELTRAGRAFQVHTTAAVAAVVAVPTTAHMLALYNGEPDGGWSYVIDYLWAQNVASTAVASQAQMLVLIGQVREATPTDAGLTIPSLSGNGSKDTLARTILNATALPSTTGTAANWFAFGQSTNKPGVAATPGYGMGVEVNGRFVIPPGRYFAVHVLANVVGETFLAGIMWHEKKFSLS